MVSAVLRRAVTTVGLNSDGICFVFSIKNFSVPSPSATLIHVQCLLLLGLRMPVLEGRIPLAKRRIGGGREVTSRLE